MYCKPVVQSLSSIARILKSNERLLLTKTRRYPAASYNPHSRAASGHPASTYIRRHMCLIFHKHTSTIRTVSLQTDHTQCLPTHLLSLSTHHTSPYSLTIRTVSLLTHHTHRLPTHSPYAPSPYTLPIRTVSILTHHTHRSLLTRHTHHLHTHSPYAPSPYSLTITGAMRIVSLLNIRTVSLALTICIASYTLSVMHLLP
jgi:hypothetical protein